MKFTNKTVLVTGASRGIGRAIAGAFAKEGARVAVHYSKSHDAAKEVIEKLTGSGHILVRADVTIPGQVEKLVHDVVEQFGKLDILVNNAGIYEEHPVDEITYEDWQQSWDNTLKTNLISVSNLCYCAVQFMKEKKYGKIINISSRGAFRGEPRHTAYGAAKAGLNSLSQSLAVALAAYNIFVGVVAPGFVLTDMTKDILKGKKGKQIIRQSPLNRVATAEEIAGGVLYLASDQAMYATGAILDINGASYLRS